MNRFPVGARVTGRGGLGFVAHVYPRRWWQRRRYVIGWDSGAVSPSDTHGQIDYAEACAANYTLVDNSN